jgi:surface antigen
MSIQQVYSRVAAIESMIGTQAGSGAAAPATSFASALASASGESGSASGVLQAAESQVGAAEQPPGSNDGPHIATYRSAVTGAQAGEPWCAYFVSWAAAQAGEPIGANGQGLGSVSEITSWASSTGRLLPASATPSPGDLILFGDQHVGIVESVNSDGTLTTVEGNYSNGVSRVTRSPSEATGYVKM